MDEYCFGRRSHIPAFGSWDYGSNDDVTRRFESAREAGLLRHNSCCEDTDLYVAGDLYEYDVVTPAVIVVPRRRLAHGMLDGEKEWKKERFEGYEYEAAPPSLLFPNASQPQAKAVDEDLYKISPHLLRVKRKRTWGNLFSSCLRPSHAC